MSDQQVIYVVTVESEQDHVKQLVDPLRVHEFFSHTDVRFVSPSQLGETTCFKQIENSPVLMSTYKRLLAGREQSNLSITTPELNEQAVLLFDLRMISRRVVLHEFGHCAAVKTTMGTELRSEYQRVASDLNGAVETGYAQTISRGNYSSAGGRLDRDSNFAICC